ncbi:formyl transferase domain protein [Thermanaerovibrio acidaminovorans DSM 6589]|uniref:Formyl transferase domain protein n=1 Tax=Thermanaerovibrio acidaminovorans (strain ATCC 49978 / DSM 6589 / Su883) TaxID=525903 RepID=D1B8B3_THEAS|nr:formyltransferase [Thermanaerovibrio acidaminovorans]ACZ18516.1 formyl transferase domain protein [Thermanaerovibrio acidaminovorans DSM 6589]
MRPRVAVCAYSQVGTRCLESLLELGANVVALFTHQDNPSENLWFRTPDRVAERHRIPVIRDSLRSPEGAMALRELKPDLLLSFYYRDMIPGELLEIPPLGAFNVHGSLLPRYRGRVSVHWAMIMGEMRTGATLHVMTPRPDDGPVVDREEVPIHLHDTSRDVMERLAEAAHRLIRRAYPTLEDGSYRAVPQDQGAASYFGGRRPEDGLIQWDREDSLGAYHMVRALTRPYPGAFSTLADGRRLTIWRAHPLPEKAVPRAEPGTLMEDPEGYVLVRCMAGALRILEAELDGRCGHPLDLGLGDMRGQLLG